MAKLDPGSPDAIHRSKQRVISFGPAMADTNQVIAASADNPMLLQIQDAATGSIVATALYGSTTSVAALNLHFITS